MIFDITKIEVIRYLLSTLRHFYETYRIDGFRVDAVTSMLYKHHGMGTNFMGGFPDYFNFSLDTESIAFIKLMIMFMKSIDPNIVFIAEDVSGFPTLCWPLEGGGIGFDYTHGMYHPELVRYVAKEFREVNWISCLPTLIHGLIHKKRGERYISYTECHDQNI